MKITRLTKQEAPAWRELRVRMLRDHPEAFGEHVDDFTARSPAEVVARISDGNVFGAFLGNKMVGAVGWRLEQGLKRAHIGYIWGMYVAPEARSRGIGGALLDTVLEEIRNAGCEVAELSVAEPNAVARDLYKSAGFIEWGSEPDALRVGGRPVTEIHMARKL